MARTIRDIPVYNRTVPEVMNEIMAWVNAHKIKIEENRGTYLRVKLKKTLGSAGLFVEAKKIIEIDVQQTPNGIAVHTEGYVKLPLGGGEKDFSANSHCVANKEHGFANRRYRNRQKCPGTIDSSAQQSQRCTIYQCALWGHTRHPR